MDQRIDRLMDLVQTHLALEAMAIDPDLAAPRTNGRGMQIKSYNWRSARFQKITVMDTSVEVPPMHQLNAIFYPRPDYDIPVFLFLTVVTKSNVIAIFNVNCPFKDAEYMATYADPLTPIFESYPALSGRDRFPDWFEKYRTPATIFGVYGKDQLEPLTRCGLDYLQLYLERSVAARKVDDRTRLKTIADFHEQFRDDIRQKDRGRGVLAKLTNEETARRIFYEVAT